MIKSKQAGRAPTADRPDFKDRKAVDLMAALRASLAATPAAGGEAEGQEAEALGDGQEAR